MAASESGPVPAGAAGGNAVAGVLVLYRPDVGGKPGRETNARDIVIRAAGVVDRLYAVDNSAPATGALGALPPGVTLIENGANLGIARALNQGMAAARADGFRYALLLDQDSRIDRMSVDRLLETHGKRADAMIVCPRVLYDDGPSPDTTPPRRETNDGIARVTPGAVRRVTVTISSGSLVDLSRLDDTGPHDEALFIDYVDFDFCLRAASKGLLTYRDDRAILHHRLGARREARFMGVRCYPTHHSPDRRYYKTRNMFTVWHRHWRGNRRWVIRSVRKLATEFLQIWLFEDRKLRKTVACVQGFIDFAMGHYGKRRSHRANEHPNADADMGRDRTVRALFRMAGRR